MSRDYGPIPLSIFDEPPYALLGLRAKFVFKGLLARCCYRGRFSGDPHLVSRALAHGAEDVQVGLDELEETRWIRRYTGTNQRGQAVLVAEIIDYHEIPGLPKDRRNKPPDTLEWPDQPPGSHRGATGEPPGSGGGASEERAGNGSPDAPPSLPPSSVQFSSGHTEGVSAGAPARDTHTPEGPRVDPHLCPAAKAWLERRVEITSRHSGVLGDTDALMAQADDLHGHTLRRLQRSPHFGACVQKALDLPDQKWGKSLGGGIRYLEKIVHNHIPDSDGASPKQSHMGGMAPSCNEYQERTGIDPRKAPLLQDEFTEELGGGAV